MNHHTSIAWPNSRSKVTMHIQCTQLLKRSHFSYVTSSSVTSLSSPLLVEQEGTDIVLFSTYPTNLVTCLIYYYVCYSSLYMIIFNCIDTCTGTWLTIMSCYIRLHKDSECDLKYKNHLNIMNKSQVLNKSVTKLTYHYIYIYIFAYYSIYVFIDYKSFLYNSPC